MEQKKGNTTTSNAAPQVNAGSQKSQQPPTAKVEGKAGVKVHKNSWTQKALRQFLLAIVFLAIGAGLIFFLIHQPAAKEYVAQKEEATRLQDIESQYNQLLTDYADLDRRHKVSVTLVNIYKIQNNVNIARIALMNDNETRLSIALGYVEKDIATLDIGEFPEKVDLSARVTAIKGYLPDEKQSALNELNALFDDLLLLANNMEITE